MSPPSRFGARRAGNSSTRALRQVPGLCGWLAPESRRISASCSRSISGRLYELQTSEIDADAGAGSRAFLAADGALRRSAELARDHVDDFRAQAVVFLRVFFMPAHPIVD